jgi:hypothetical protein
MVMHLCRCSECDHIIPPTDHMQIPIEYRFGGAMSVGINGRTALSIRIRYWTYLI